MPLTPDWQPVATRSSDRGAETWLLDQPARLSVEMALAVGDAQTRWRWVPDPERPEWGVWTRFVRLRGGAVAATEIAQKPRPVTAQKTGDEAWSTRPAAGGSPAVPRWGYSPPRVYLSPAKMRAGPTHAPCASEPAAWG